MDALKDVSGAVLHKVVEVKKILCGFLHDGSFFSLVALRFISEFSACTGAGRVQNSTHSNSPHRKNRAVRWAAGLGCKAVMGKV